MSTSVTLRELRPDLRIVALSLVEAGGARFKHAHGTSRGQSDTYSSESYLALVRPGVQVVIDGAPDTEQALDDVWSKVPERDTDLYHLANLVVVLDAFDRSCREAQIFAGNIYLACEASVEALARVAGISQGGADITRLLAILQHAELMYRFPVAFKFRGAHAVDRQCRLNGWGRLLAKRLGNEPWAREVAAVADRLLVAHLHENRQEYVDHLEACLIAVDDGKGNEWMRALTLAIPVLT